MDPFLLLVIFLVGVPVLSIVLLGVFAATADYEFRGLRVRGGHLRGAIAAAAAKILVRDAETFQLPLLVTLERTGLLGHRTPLLGGATIRDVEARIYLDGEHVSTVTEAGSIRIGDKDSMLELPVNAELHLPRGLLATVRQLNADRRSAREVELKVQGHVIVKHWLMTREVPVRVKQYVVFGTALPELKRLEWRLPSVGHGADERSAVPTAELELELVNPYRDERLQGDLRVQVRHDRRLRRDPELGAWQRPIDLRPGRSRTDRFVVAVEVPVQAAEAPTSIKPLRVHARVLYDGQVLHLPDGAGEVAPLRPALGKLQRVDLAPVPVAGLPGDRGDTGEGARARVEHERRRDRELPDRPLAEDS